MKKIKYALFLAATVLLFAFTAVQSVEWKIADKYAIRFTSKDPSGVFTRFSGDISFDTNHLETSSFDLFVDAASISTGNGMKNKHAKSEEWLDAETYPEIRFISSRFTKTGDRYEVSGTLDLHGVKKEIIIPFTFENNTFTGSFTVNRVDHNIGKTTGMYGKVSQDLQIDLSVPVTKK